MPISVKQPAPRRPAAARWGLTIAAALAALASPSWLLAAAPPRVPRGGPQIEFETTSAFSRIRVRRQAGVRTLIFVRDNGEEAEQSIVNTKRPYELLDPYARYMFTSYLFQPQPEQVLIIGLGGGAMVHFLQHYEPQVRVDVVEIDPAVVKIAAEYFECRSGGNVRITTDDGGKYLETSETQYDVIYLDAFLKPTAETDEVGAPLRMKTGEFYAMLQRRLKPEGVVVFNLNQHQATAADLAAIRNAFAQVYVFRPITANYVAVATMTAARVPSPALRTKARELDSRFHATFSFSDLVKHVLP